jgi:hypothetical protein
MATERADRLHELERFRSCTYNQWVTQLEAVYRSLNMKLPTRSTTPLVRPWRQWVFHPVWSFSWADQEELFYLQHAQDDLEATRSAVRQGSWIALNEGLTKIHQSFRFPPASWRFYHVLPLLQDMNEIIGTPKVEGSTCVYGDFSRAWRATMRNLTLHELAATAMALKRYELRHGKPPASLDGLVPELLPGVPRDYMDGRPLRYRLGPDGSFTLYSVGEDGVDSGGSPAPRPTQGSSLWDYPWTGPDWVWPRS